MEAYGSLKPTVQVRTLVREPQIRTFMYIKHSTAVPIKLPKKLIEKVRENHIDVRLKSQFKARENTGDVTFRLTQPTSISKWA